MPTIWHEAELIGQKEEAKGTNRFWFRILEDTPLHYEAGQFLTFDLPTGDKRAQRWRSYSIANNYDGSNIIELCIAYKKDGLASEYFFNTINKGDKIKFKGPEGTFLIPSDLQVPIVMIATGTGIAPFRTMLQKIEKDGMRPSNIHLIFGTRTLKSFLYQEDLEYYNHFIENFKLCVCFSREKKIPKSKISSITYHSGYVHEVYLQDKKINPSKTLFMICGYGSMIDDAVSNLINTLKVPKNLIRIEMFG